jgi:DNA polymerase-3 subunit beta
MRIEIQLPQYTGESILLPHAKLLAILREAGGDDVTFTLGGSTVKVACGYGVWNLPTEDAEAYPVWDASETYPLPHMPSDQFCRAVSGVAFAAAAGGGEQHALDAVLIDVSGEVASFVATDGRRLACVFTEHDTAVDDSKTLVPVAAIKTIAQIAGTSGDACVWLQAGRNSVEAVIGPVKVSSLLVAGSFPSWRKLIPESAEDGPCITALVSELLSATKQAAIVTTETSRGVDFSFTPDGINLHSRSSEAGEAKVSCSVQGESAAASCAVKLDPRYVQEFLLGLPVDGEPVVRVYTYGPDAAVLLMSDDHRGVIMPLAGE